MFKKVVKKPPMTKRKVFEYTLAGTMTGLCVPTIYRGYNKIFSKVQEKLSLDMDDLIRMYERDHREDGE